MAAEVPIIERISGSVSWSVERVVTVTWISERHCLGRRGRMGRSVRRAGTPASGARS